MTSMAATLIVDTTGQIRAVLTEQILREGNFQPRVAAAIAAIKTPRAPNAGKGHQAIVQAGA
jgi:hypothetical protein